MQILRYKWKNFKPSLLIKEGKTEKIIPLIGNEINFQVDKKLCTGYGKNGKIFQCSELVTSDEIKCNSCATKDYFFMCVKCDGSDCKNLDRREKCKKEDYFIYISAFDSILKIGISQGYRLMQRLVEQGADFGAKVCRVKDGKTVRKIEKEIGEMLSIPDRVRGIQKQDKIFGNPNTSIKLIFNCVAKLKNSSYSEYMVPVEIFDLRSHYNTDKILKKPEIMQISEGSIIKGLVIAIKGNIIVIENELGLFSFNIHEVLGREILYIKDLEVNNYNER